MAADEYNSDLAEIAHLRRQITDLRERIVAALANCGSMVELLGEAKQLEQQLANLRSRIGGRP